MRKMGEGRGGEVLWKEGGGSESDPESLHTLCLCGSCFRLYVKGNAQGIGNAMVNSDHPDASWNQYIELKQLKRRRGWRKQREDSPRHTW